MEDLLSSFVIGSPISTKVQTTQGSITLKSKTLPRSKRRMLLVAIFASTCIYGCSLFSIYKKHGKAMVEYNGLLGTVYKAQRTKKEANATKKLRLTSNVIPSNIVNNSSSIVVRSQNTLSLVVPANPLIYFIHVGKAGGTTLVTALRLKEIAGGSGTHGVLCMDKRGISSCYNHSSGVSQLTQHTLGYFHAKGGGRKNRKGRAWLLNNTNMFLFNVRDPIGRLISAFNYHRQCPYRRGRKCGYGQDPICRMCFSEGFSEMVETLQNGVVECSKIGVDALLGRIGSCGDHFEFNYEHYWKYSVGQRPDHAIAVVRMEHMWDDIIQLDQLFGGTGNFGTFQEVKITHRSEKNAVFLSTDISDTNTIFLCCLIAREIEIYQQLILKAWNLDAIQKRKSLNNLLDRCLIEPSGDILELPFSWKGFQLGATCRKSLGWFVPPHAALATFGIEDSKLHWCTI